MVIPPRRCLPCSRITAAPCIDGAVELVPDPPCRHSSLLPFLAQRLKRGQVPRFGQEGYSGVEGSPCQCSGIYVPAGPHLLPDSGLSGVEDGRGVVSHW